MQTYCAKCKTEFPIKKADKYTLMCCTNCGTEHMYEPPYGWLNRSGCWGFEEEFNKNIEPFQQRYYEMLKYTGLNANMLSESEKVFVLHLASTNSDAAASFISIVNKAKNPGNITTLK